MPISPISGATASSSSSSPDAVQKSFRQADFLKIMLSEITNQNPLDPQETGKMIDGMQKLQELANATYTKFRGDLQWAQDLSGKQVQVQQQALTPTQLQQAKDKGLNPDVGYATHTGTITSFRVVDENVFVHIDGHDYPIDNVRQVVPPANDPQQLLAVSQALLGRQVGFYRATEADRGQGKVTDVAYGVEGEIQLTVDDERVPYSHLTRIGIAP